MQAANGNRIPSLGRQFVNMTKAAGRVTNAAIHGRTMIVPPEVRAQREAICKECPENLEGRCRKCGCGIRAQWLRKTHLATERCPLSPPKWIEWT